MTPRSEKGPRDEMLGQRAGNYQLVSQLGMGGMGAVYLARHMMLGRPAAVKVLLPELSQHREIVNRFFNEAKAATAIRHPSIVEIYDFGFLPSGNAYIIMELLEGESLARRLERMGSLSVEESLLLVRQIAGALHAAHERQIVHRDLKPDNLFVVHDSEIPGGERIKLLDFGIAKLALEPGDKRTRTGAVMGTPAYMSPEQCRGAGVIDGRTDLYALGCILYELLCGRPPFVSEGAGDIIAHHLYFTPESPRRYQPTIPQRVEPLVMGLLQKDPSMRPASATQVITAIDELGFGAPRAANLLPAPRAPGFALPTVNPTTLHGAAAQRTTVTKRLRRGARGWRLTSVGGVLLAGVMAAWWSWSGAEPREREVEDVSPRRNSSETEESPSLEMLTPSIAPDAQLSSIAVPPSPLVRLTIESVPSSADVWLDGGRVGVTPFQAEVPRGERPRAYLLRRPGYLDAPVELSTGEDGSERVRLRRTPTKPVARQPVKRATSSSAPSSANPGTSDGVNPFD